MTELIFVEPGVKVNCLQPVLPQSLAESAHASSNQMCRMRQVCLSQDSTPAHRTRETIQLLQQETTDFISPDLWQPINPDLNPIDYKI